MLASSSDTHPIYIYTIENSAARVTGYRVGSRIIDQNETVYDATVVWQMYLRSKGSVGLDDKVPHSVVASASRSITGAFTLMKSK